MTFDSAHVAAIEDLETKTRAWIADLRAAIPMLKRLEVAGFAGMDLVLSELPEAEIPSSFVSESPWAIVYALQTTRRAGGDEITLSWLLEVAPVA